MRIIKNMANLRTHRAVLADIIDLHLDPSKPHTVTGKDGRLKARRSVLADIADLHLDPTKSHTIGNNGRLKMSHDETSQTVWCDELVVTPIVVADEVVDQTVEADESQTVDETVETPIADEAGVVNVGRRRNKKTTK